MRLCEELETGREVEVDMVNDVLTDLTTGKKYSLKPLGDVSGGAAPRRAGAGATWGQAWSQRVGRSSSGGGGAALWENGLGSGL